MRIYRMTATFGKLRHETLTLEPGLNIIEAPNEWGKSTWCAFLIAMFYGLDTRAKSTKSGLADKERYLPWSGELMAGRIDLNWRGRDITIERSTRRRIPLGDFKAYETASGLPVAELTAANCGEWLLGVEQSVFRRAGFIRFTDLPVTQDESLRARLNALVTTGDESGDAERIDKELRDLKNRCRYKRTGLLPQAEEQLAAVEGKLREMEELSEALEDMKQRHQALEQERLALENHLAAMDYEEAQEDARQVARAKEAYEAAEEKFRLLDQRLQTLPTREETAEKLLQLEKLTQLRTELDIAEAKLPELPEEPKLPEVYQVEDPRAMLEEDRALYRKYSRKSIVWWCLGGALVIAAIVLAVLKLWIWVVGAVGLGSLALAVGLMFDGSRREKRLTLESKYGAKPELWEKPLADHEQALAAHREKTEEILGQREDLSRRRAGLEEEKRALCGDLEPERAEEVCRQVQEQWDALDEAGRDLRRSKGHMEALAGMVRQVAPPAAEDALTCSVEETRQRLGRIQEEQWTLQNRSGRNQGRMQSLGAREPLEQECAAIRQRIVKLEDTYAALTIAQETLAQARLELQRRFAPRIVQRARELMEAMTSGRYTKLGLQEDLSIAAGTAEEDTLQSILWRSDGTVDQLYLALRLAVAEALAPEAPLILDDALVRFDDVRLKSAVKILSETAKEKQVLLFTCHGREKNAI